MFVIELAHESWRNKQFFSFEQCFVFILFQMNKLKIQTLLVVANKCWAIQFLIDFESKARFFITREKKINFFLLFERE